MYEKLKYCRLYKTPMDMYTFSYNYSRLKFKNVVNFYVHITEPLFLMFFVNSFKPIRTKINTYKQVLKNFVFIVM